jgi:hypothetical protein
MRIYFSESIEIPDDYTLFNNTILNITIIPGVQSNIS